jgi:hypothetical protein
VIFSPRFTRSSNSDRWVFASKAPTESMTTLSTSWNWLDYISAEK